MQKGNLNKNKNKKVRPTIHVKQKMLLGSHSSKHCVSGTMVLVKPSMICVPAGQVPT